MRYKSKKQTTNEGFRWKYTPGYAMMLRSVHGNLKGLGIDSYWNGLTDWMSGTLRIESIAEFHNLYCRMVSNNTHFFIAMYCNAQLNPRVCALIFTLIGAALLFFHSAGQGEQITFVSQCRVRLLKTSLTQLTCTVTLTNWMSATTKEPPLNAKAAINIRLRSA